MPVYNAVVYRKGSLYYAENSNGEYLIAPTTAAETAIQKAIDQTGDVCIVDGTYQTSANFSGFSIATNTRVHCSKLAVLRVPSAYTGYFLRYGPTKTTNTTWEGGYIQEAGPVSRAWSCFDYLAGVDGIFFNEVKDAKVDDCGTLIKLDDNNENAFINSNTWKDIVTDEFVIGVNFVGTNSVNYDRNLFQNIQGQSFASTTYGVKNLFGDANEFWDIKWWDLNLNGAAVSCEITSDAADTKIIGGIMTNQNFSDAGTRTRIIADQWGSASGTGTIESASTSDVITHGLPYTPLAHEIHIVLTENPTNTPGAIWVDTIGATTFTVNCENDPGASNLDFAWAVRRV